MKTMPGYVMVDANGLDLSNTETQTISGLYSRLIDALATGKAVMLTGLLNATDELSPVYVALLPVNGVTIVSGNVSVTVNTHDEAHASTNQSH